MSAVRFGAGLFGSGDGRNIRRRCALRMPGMVDGGLRFENRKPPSVAIRRNELQAAAVAAAGAAATAGRAPL